ncbi:MAG: hypothetical protein JW900_04915 [Anaerolineae bacterium]|nr:hypothetical protein [Anaerolineae bacterium]
MPHDNGSAQTNDGPTCLVALLAPFLVLCTIVGYATLDGGGITQHDEETGVVQVLTWHGWEPAGEPARQLSAPPVPASGRADPPPVPLPTTRPAPTVILAEPTIAAALAPAAGDGTTSRYTGYSVVEPPPATPVAPVGLSPWTLLGWILVILVPAALLVGIGLAVHRYRTTARRPLPDEAGPVAPAGALPVHVVGDAAAEPNQQSVDPSEASAPPAAPERTYIADFLSAERVLEALAAGGTHDAPVCG